MKKILIIFSNIINMNYPYNYFITKKNISIEILKNNISTNIFKTNNISILKKYDSEIQLYIKKNNLSLKELENNLILKKLSEFYDLFLLKKQNIEYFFELMIEFKDIIDKNQNNILYFLAFNKIIESNYNENMFIINPISHKNFKLGFLDKNYIELNTSDNVKIALDILTQGDYINFTLPSIGPIYNYISDKNNYIDYINNIINNTDINLDINNLPLVNLKLYNNVLKNLLNISYDQLTNNYNYNYDLEINEMNEINEINKMNFNKYNHSVKNLVKRRIQGIQITLEEIYLINTNNKNKNKNKNKKVKNEFIIPYKVDKNQIKEMTKNDIDRIKDYNKLIENNNNIFIYVIEDIFKEDSTKIKKMENKNYKNVLSCYLFYIINILSKILYLYIDKVYIIIKDIIEIKYDIIKILNIKSAFEYISLLKQSILKFKKILLNNFYYMFLPSNFLEGNYGMKVNQYGCYIPESIFIRSNDYIMNKYPFNILITGIDKKIILKEDLIKEFFISINEKNDLYDKKFILEFGCNIFNEKIMSETFEILNNYYKLYQKYNGFNLFIISKIINYVQIDKNIPYELINEYLPFFINLNDPNIPKKIINVFKNNMIKTKDCYIKYYNLNLKLKEIKKTDINVFINKKNIFELSFNAQRTKTLSLIYICEKLIKNTKDKNYILNSIYKIKKEYENIIIKYLKK